MMKGILLKDIYAFMRSGKFLLIVAGAYCFFGALSMNTFFFGFASIFMAMLPVSMMGMDEKINWDSYAVMLPVSRKDLVISKYIIGLAGVGIVFLLYVCVGSIAAFLGGNSVSLAEKLSPIMVIVFVAFLFIAINIPIMFKMGAEKGRLLYFLSMGLIVVAVLGLEKIAESNSGLVTAISAAAGSSHLMTGMGSIIFPLAGLAAILISIKISIGIFEKKEL